MEDMFTGDISDARVYDRVLRAAEVAALYANTWELYRPLVPYVLGMAPVVGSASP